MARVASRCWTSASPSTCLYSDGGRTPSRSASRPMVTPWNPISSASPAAEAITSSPLSPALGNSVLLEEAGHQGGHLVRALRMDVMTAALDHRDRAPPGRHLGHN